ncbi:hypothetical protein CEXT_159791 [Caerostris extrusa]|uniref:Ribosomal protein S11 n=1 Tax=Caerostris extrusa TaxID=172846 RepID=A0AAV4NF82_CAEEX|nr:hypothetical protein CEXT_159791 [Caerostris extrusa]
MSITSKSTSISKEMSVEESYSKTSSSVSSSVMSSKMESSKSFRSSTLGDLFWHIFRGQQNRFRHRRRHERTCCRIKNVLIRKEFFCGAKRKQFFLRKVGIVFFSGHSGVKPDHVHESFKGGGQHVQKPSLNRSPSPNRNLFHQKSAKRR